MFLTVFVVNINVFGSGRFEVLEVARMNIQVFWDVTPCRLVNSYRRFGGA